MIILIIVIGIAGILAIDIIEQKTNK